MGLEFMFGLTIGNIKENGREIKCMGKELQLGQTDVVMRESK